MAEKNVPCTPTEISDTSNDRAVSNNSIIPISIVNSRQIVRVHKYSSTTFLRRQSKPVHNSPKLCFIGRAGTYIPAKTK
ncbi:hypothetical protein GOBAR_AA29400 [Gossypium barbadense]|uniref:Uncharacterized protein n=1 Tax=Gossypium barbadense TaxID=3634 RepID=A0A2P5WJK5_GOSBA|nr:hypothetical protein GOBAR_AA29400 [Gossypium barbadense]